MWGKVNEGVHSMGDAGMLGRLVGCGVGWAVCLGGSAVSWMGGEWDVLVGDGALENVPVVGEKVRRSWSVFSRCNEGCRGGVDSCWSCADVGVG